MHGRDRALPTCPCCGMLLCIEFTATSAPPAAAAAAGVAAAASPFNTASAPRAAATAAAAPHVSLWPVLCQPLLQARLVLLVQKRPALVRQVEKLVKVPADAQDADVDGAVEGQMVGALNPALLGSGTCRKRCTLLHPKLQTLKPQTTPNKPQTTKPTQKTPATCRPVCHTWRP